MGQYHIIVNIDKNEFLDPVKFGDDQKILAFGQSRNGTLLALTALLAESNGRGGGDICSDDPLIGSWAGDRIMISGDYADTQPFLTDREIKSYRKKAIKEALAEGDTRYVKNLETNEINLYMICSMKGSRFKNISNKIRKVLKEADVEIGEPEKY